MRHTDIHITLIARHGICNSTIEQTVEAVFTQLLDLQRTVDTAKVQCVVETAPLGKKSPRRDLRILIDGWHAVASDLFLDRLLQAAPELSKIVVSALMGPSYTGNPLYGHATRGIPSKLLA